MLDPIVRPDTQISEDWMALIFLGVMAMLAYTRYQYPSRFSRLWNSVWNVRVLRQTMREEPNTPRANLFFNAVFFLIGSLIIFMMLKWFKISPLGLSGFWLFSLVCTCLVLIYVIKAVGVRMVQLMADGDFGLAEYEYNVFLVNRLSGLLLLPIVVFSAYAPLSQLKYYLLILGITWGLMIVYRLLRGVYNALSGGIPLFYIFFYICTLEILPLVVCIKALSV